MVELRAFLRQAVLDAIAEASILDTTWNQDNSFSAFTPIAERAAERIMEELRPYPHVNQAGSPAPRGEPGSRGDALDR